MTKQVEIVKHGTPEWHAYRTKGIGASEIAVIAGLNKCRSPLQLWCEKTGRNPEPTPVNDAMWLGTKLEPTIAEFFNYKTGIELVPDVGGRLYVHPEVEWAYATPDFGLRSQDDPNELGLLECKNTSYRALAQWKEAIPFTAQCQLQWQLACCGLRWGHVAGLVGNAELIHERFDYSDDIICQLFELGQKFWDLVKSDTPPAATENDDKIVEAIIGERQKGLIDLPAEAYPLVKEYKRLQLLKKSLEENLRPVEAEFKAAKNQLLQAVGPHTGARFDDGEIKLAEVNVKARMNPAYSYTRMTVKFNDSEGADE